MAELIEVKGLDELITRMNAYPAEMTKVAAVGMSASLNALWESVPPYPQVPNPVRDGTLAKSLGSGESGGASGGQPDIYTIRKLGGGNYEGTFGTRLSYSVYVIGEMQAWFHYRWWVIKDVAERAAGKINEIWQAVGDRLAKFLEGKKS